VQPDVSAEAVGPTLALTIDELAARADLPVRTIREYQTIGLLPAPAKRGRVGIYGDTHVTRLALIDRLQQRGYSLAGIRDLVSAWRDGAELGEILGLQPDQLVHVDEPGAPAAIEQLAQLLPALIPTRLSELVATGVVEMCGPDRYCVPSPSLLQLTIDALAAGYDPHRVLDLLGVVGRAADTIADAVLATLTDPPSEAIDEHLVQLATRGRGLLGHGVGRLTIHSVGRRLGITDETAVPDALRAFFESDHP
jgi:DNA-binding transcriptional MerR regulator